MRYVPGIVICCTMAACSSEAGKEPSAIKVEVVKTETGFMLERGGERYVVKGAGMAIDDIERFAAHGGNSIRNWSTMSRYQDTSALLDKAHANGVTVALGLPMKAERHGFDYDDAGAVADQLERMREEVIKYRDHPAVLVWLIGNELNHSYTNPRVYDAVDDVAKKIHELDPNHPTSTTVAGFDAEVVAEIRKRAPDLDFISFQLYGSLFGLPGKMNEAGFEAPFMVTEWGTIGYWEMEQASWGVPAELTSSEKADVFLRAHRDVLATFEGQLIGSYAFFWGQKQERTPTWFGMLTETGEETEVVDVMHYLWNGSWPENRTPRVNALLLDGKRYRDSVTLAVGEAVVAELDVTDPENDPVTYRWEVKAESAATQEGGDFEEPIASLPGIIGNPAAAKTTVTAPAPGAYRLFAYAYDDHGHAAHANIPFLVRERNE